MRWCLSDEASAALDELMAIANDPQEQAGDPSIPVLSFARISSFLFVQLFNSTSKQLSAVSSSTQI